MVGAAPRVVAFAGGTMGGVYDFIANTADGAFAVDRGQTIVMWNNAAAALTGRRAGDVLGRKCFSVMRGRDATDCAVCRSRCAPFEAAGRFEPTAAVEMAIRTADDQERWLSVSTVLVPSCSDELSVLVHLFREVTEGPAIARTAHELAALVTSHPAPASTGPRADGNDRGLIAKLTRREREILTHLTQGRSTERIAERLSVNSRTVRNHVTNILGKLGVHSRLEAVARATRSGPV